MSKLINLIALSSLLVIGTSYGTAPVTALSIEHHARSGVSVHHDGLAKRKRAAKRCKPRMTSTTTTTTPEETQTENNNGGGDNNEGGNEGGEGEGGDGGNNNGGDSTPNNTGGAHSQLGFAWTMGSEHLSKYKQNKNALIYNWGATGPNQDGFTFMPMLWGDKNKASFKSAVDKKTPEFALGPNEPELVNDSGLSSGMDVQSVVSAYWEFLHPLAQKGVKILTPAVTSGPAGFEWMTKFMQACSGCQFAGQALHWYDINHQDAISHFKKHHNAFGLPIYNTEIAFYNFNDANNQLSWQGAYDEMHAFNEWVKGEGSSFMKVVMYFGFQDDMTNVYNSNLKLINSDHSPNALGQMIINDLGQ